MIPQDERTAQMYVIDMPRIIPVEQWDAEKFRQLQEEHAQFRIVRIVPPPRVA